VSPEDYEKEGQQFYKLAAEHQSAIELELSETFWCLHQNFHKAKKPLNFIAEHYLRYSNSICKVSQINEHCGFAISEPIALGLSSSKQRHF
jgi:hypothetical protein